MCTIFRPYELSDRVIIVSIWEHLTLINDLGIITFKIYSLSMHPEIAIVILMIVCANVLFPLIYLKIFSLHVWYLRGIWVALYISTSLLLTVISGDIGIHYHCFFLLIFWYWGWVDLLSDTSISLSYLMFNVININFLNTILFLSTKYIF